MRKHLFVLSVLLTTQHASSQLIQARFVSSAYGWKQQDTVGKSSNHLFGYQTIQFSATKEQFSLHTYWQGFNEFAGDLQNRGQYRLYNLYLRGTNLFNLADITVGRQPVFAGVGAGTIDGALAAVKLLDSQVKISGYYGSLPPPSQEASLIGNAKNNSMAGAQVFAMPAEYAQLSLSYMKRTIQPDVYTATRRDSLFNPSLIEIRPSAREEKYLSGDFNLEYEDFASLYGRYDYDMLLEKRSRIQLFTRVKATGGLGVTAEYLQRDPRISFNSIFTAFTYNSLKEYQLGIEYSLTEEHMLYLRYGSLSYSDEDVKTITVGGNSRHVGASVSTSTGYPGDLTSVSLNAGYPMMDNSLTPTLILSYARYKLNEQAPLEGALSTGFGAVYRPLPELSLDAQFQWIQNKVYKSDTRLFLRVSYLFLERLDLF
ncbi:MAG: hypothetical protein HW374_260 [Bacteroidetes bacterium]|nr:hypothetical protein [Bacteroidota bacterium]